MVESLNLACPNILEKMCLETEFQPFRFRNDQDNYARVQLDVL